MALERNICASCEHTVGQHDEWGCAFCVCFDQYLTTKENN